MFLRLLFSFFFLSIQLFAHAKAHKTMYPLMDDPIDVVICTHPKDKATLEGCIDGIRANCDQVRRVVVVSSIKLTDKAEWFDENKFPFSKDDVADAIVRGDKKKKKEFFRTHRGQGWYYQQLLKLYSSFVIPNLSSNVLIIDSDTIFLNPVTFLNSSMGALFCVNEEDAAKPAYFAHAKRLVPGYKRVFPDVYSVCHHMLFQKPILEDLFRIVEDYHKTEFWVAFCTSVDLKANRGASEFEIYYNFALTHTNQVELRELKWTNCGNLMRKNEFQRKGFHFVSFHTYLRSNNPLLNLNN